MLTEKNIGQYVSVSLFWSTQRKVTFWQDSQWQWKMDLLQETKKIMVKFHHANLNKICFWWNSKSILYYKLFEPGQTLIGKGINWLLLNDTLEQVSQFWCMKTPVLALQMHGTWDEKFFAIWHILQILDDHLFCFLQVLSVQFVC